MHASLREYGPARFRILKRLIESYFAVLKRKTKMRQEALMKKLLTVILCTLMVIGNTSVSGSVYAQENTGTSADSSKSADSSASAGTALESTNTANPSSVSTEDSSASENGSSSSAESSSTTDINVLKNTDSTDVTDAADTKTSADIINADDSSGEYTVNADASTTVTGVFLYTPVTENELVTDIQAGQSVVAFIGTASDSTFEEVIEGYHDIYTTLDDAAKENFMQIDPSSINDTDTASLMKLAYGASEKANLQKALDGVVNGTKDTGAVLYSYNKTISTLKSVINGKSDNLTWKDCAIRDYASGWRVEPYPVTKTSTSSRLLMSYFISSAPAYQTGHVEKFYGANKYQTFTALVSGTYHIQLWGADGDCDAGQPHGAWANSDKSTNGFGGGGGYTYGDVHLKHGQTIYLALGRRNEFSVDQAYNGGGTGFGAEKEYRAGGGGAASVYWELVGKGNLYEYVKSDGTPDEDKIIMVAGGGGGAEDFYDTYTNGTPTYYCSLHVCENARGGNGGPTATKGSSNPGNDGLPASYKFGLGQNYASGWNASSGAGGAGWIGGGSASYDANDRVLRGGSGGGGSSWVNTTATGDKAVTNYGMENGTNVVFQWLSDTKLDNEGQDARATITLLAIDQYNLTINYIDNNDKTTKIATSYTGKFAFGDSYKVLSPDVTGYKAVSIYNEDTKETQDVATEADKTVSGDMPEHDLVIDVYYDYTSLTVHYQNYDTKEDVAPANSQKMKTGTAYDIVSPDVENMVRYDDTKDHITGTKAGTDEDYYVYYVPKMVPHKDIIDVNGHAVTKEESDAGVDLKNGDIVTYSIGYENYRGVAVDLPITDTLESYLEYQDDSGVPAPTVSADKKTLTWDINVPARDAAIGSVSAGAVTFKAKVVAGTIDTVNNWTRKDPYVQYGAVKSADPVDGSYVAYNQEITYTLTVTNSGSHAVHNVVVLDKIPDNTAFVSVDHSYSGSYVTDGNYVRYVIPSIPAKGKALLTFKVKVTAQITDNSTVDIKNFAYFDNVYNTSETDLDKNVFATGKTTNVVTHHLQGPVISGTKTANPVSGTMVKAGDTIAYSIKLTNVGTVKSNFIRTTDDIPAGTTYVDGSLNLTSENTDANNKYAVTYGNSFDLHYDFATSQYYLDNVRGITVGGTAGAIRVTWPAGLTLAAETVPTGWTVGEKTATTAYYLTFSNYTADDYAAYLKSLRFGGTYGQAGDVTVITYSQTQGSGTSNGLTASYDSATGLYSLSGTTVTDVTGAVSSFTVSWPAGLAVSTSSPSANWTASNGTNSITYTTPSDNTAALIKTFIDGMKFSGFVSSGTFGVTITYSYDAATEGGWKYDSANGHSYRFISTALSWPNARAAALATCYNGTCAYLAHVTSAAIETFLRNNWNTYGYAGGHRTGNDFAWTGTWVWADGPADAWSYTNWASGQPNNDGGVQPYLGIFDYNSGHGGRWNDDYYYGYYGSYGAGHYEEYPGAVPNGTRTSAKSATVQTTITQLGTSTTTLPLPSASGGCKYVTTNGDPYVECVTSDLAVGQSATMNFSVKISDPVPAGQTKILNTAKYETLWTDPGDAGVLTTKPAESTNTTEHPLQTPADINAVKSSNPVTGSTEADAVAVKIGSTIKYTIQVSNAGDTPADYVVVRDAIPENTMYVEGSADNSGVFVNGQYVEWVLKDVAKGVSQSVSFSVTVNRDANGGAYIKNIAKYQSYTENPGDAGTISTEPGNSTNETVHRIPTAIAGEPAVNVSVLKSADPAEGTSLARNTDITYNLHVANTGEGILKYVVVRDYIPAGTTYKETPTYTGGTLSADTKVETAYVAGTKPYVEWKISQLAVADSVDLKFKVTIDKETTLTKIDNSALYSIVTGDDPGKPGEIATEPGNGTNNVEHPLIDPSVTVTKSADPLPGSMVAHGQTIKYILTVTNNGTVNDNYVAVTDAIPEHTSFVAGSTVVKTGDSAALSADGKTVQFLLKDMAPAEVREISFKVTVNDDIQQGGKIYNHALYETTIQTPGNPGDPTFPTIPDDTAHSTNTVEHQLEFMNSTLQTGGEGWNKTLGYAVAAGCVAVLLVIVYLKKRKTQQ
jgi:uncharacterized repeat protein (TIGR01451 family)